MEKISLNFDNKIASKLQTFVDDDRMAGVSNYKNNRELIAVDQSFDNVLSSYQMQSEPIDIDIITDKESEFGFLDIIDMVNPLQHIPVVNYIYRAITGDEIKPASKIIGGGIYGGAVGAASGVVTALIEEKTGKDMVGNALSIVGINRDNPSYITREQYAYKDLPASLLEFAETPMSPKNVIDNDNKYALMAQGRSAGNISVYS